MSSMAAAQCVYAFSKGPNGTIYVPSLDTMVPNTTQPGPFFDTLWQANGKYIYTFQSVLDSTSCNIQPTQSALIERSVVSMACKPEWFTGPGDVVNFHPPTGQIVIAVPSEFADAVEPARAAAADWQVALGRTVTVVENSECAPNDPLCVGLRNDHGTLPGDPVGCASLGTATYNATTGTWGGSTAVRFEPNWTGGHADNLRKTIAHELGHYFGLANRLDATCGLDETVMSAGKLLFAGGAGGWNCSRADDE
ncbi:MAG TPA: hypothetical protein VNJ02_16085 [Vicinamibacterales bacterium]|nr:hypothetical protein [Vicinamibacterales bacterium]